MIINTVIFGTVLPAHPANTVHLLYESTVSFTSYIYHKIGTSFSSFPQSIYAFFCFSFLVKTCIPKRGFRFFSSGLNCEDTEAESPFSSLRLLQPSSSSAIFAAAALPRSLTAPFPEFNALLGNVVRSRALLGDSGLLVLLWWLLCPFTEVSIHAFCAFSLRSSTDDDGSCRS